MNRHHMATFLWLRWRLAVNQMRRAGLVSFVFSMILVGIGIMGGIIAFVLAFALGVPLLGHAAPFWVLVVWDVLVVAFVVFWTTGVIAELQRSELLGIEKFLHLPVTLGGVFLMNYLGSFVSISLIIFLPATTGLILALSVTHGPILFVVFLPLTALVFAVTALTYQFRGWLGAMMTDPRKRRFVISLITMIFVLLAQLPNLVNLAFQPGHAEPNDDVVELRRKLEDLEAPHPDAAPEAVQRERAKIVAELNERLVTQRIDRKRAMKDSADSSEHLTVIASTVVPIGWIPYSAMAAVEGRIGPSLIATIALSLIGAASLRRSYLTTIRMHTGQFVSGRTVAKPPAPTGRIPLIERSVPGLSEQASAVAVMSLRSFLRAPEAKIMLMTPVIMVVVFGAMTLTRSFRPPPELRPIVAFGAMASALLSIAQMLLNPFGFDRSGFRALVLSSAPRRDLLLGKNLSFAPIVFALQGVFVLIVQILLPLRIDHLLALIPQAVTMYVLFCLVSNVPAILAPTPVPARTVSGMTQVIRLAFGIASPFVLALALVPYGIEVLLGQAWGATGPIALEVAVVEAVLASLLYRVALGWEGRLLQRRELDILAVVAAKAE